MKTMPNPPPFIDVVSKLLKQATDLALSKVTPDTIRSKSDGSILTGLDTTLNEFFVSELRAKFPDHQIISEEDKDWELREHGHGYVWVIDPLDGSTNYAHNFPLYGISLGLLKNGIPVFGALGLLHQGVLLCADESGAYAIMKNGREKVIASKQSQDINKMVVLLDRGGTFSSKKRFSTTVVPRIMSKVRAIRIFGSATVSMAAIINGFDAFVGNDMHLYDIAAGVAVARAAGLGVYNFNGDEWRPQAVSDVLITDPTLKNSLIKLIGDI